MGGSDILAVALGDHTRITAVFLPRSPPKKAGTKQATPRYGKDAGVTTLQLHAFRNRELW